MSSHRGKMQSGKVRSGIWVKDGMKERIRKAAKRITGQKVKQDETVASES